MFSFGAKATITKVETLYDYCSIYKNNNFKLKGLKTLDASKSLVCLNKIFGYVESGFSVCKNYNYYYSQLVKEKVLKNSDQELIELFASTTANALTKPKQAILSFLNWVEKNPDKFDRFPLEFTSDYLSAVFPCEIKKLEP